MEQVQETKQGRRNRLMLRRMAKWAHVKKRKPSKGTFRRFWRSSSYRNPLNGPAVHMDRRARRASAKSLWKVVRKRGRSHA